MRIHQQTIIAGIIICLILIFIFVFYQIFLLQTKIVLKETSIIKITPKMEEWNSTKPSNILPTVSKMPIAQGVFSVDMRVRIFKTDGDGLTIRSFAGLEGDPIYLGLDGEEFIIIEGPKIVDNQIWWKIASIVNPQKNGWAVQDYLINN